MNISITHDRLNHIALFLLTKIMEYPADKIPAEDIFSHLVKGMVTGQYQVIICQGWFDLFMRKREAITIEEIKIFTRLLLEQYVEGCKSTFLR